MDSEAIDGGQETMQPESYGIFGLAVSLVAAAILMALIAAVIVAILSLVFAALFGWTAFWIGLASLSAASASRNMAQIELIAYALGSVIYIAAALALIILARHRAGRRWRELVAWNAWAPWRSGWRYWALVAAALIYGLAASFALSQAYPQSQNWFPAPLGLSGQVLSLVLVVALAPIAEEMLFRGWIYTNLRSRWPFWATMTVTAALFAGAHWESTHLYALVVFPIGLLLGFIRERTGSIKATATLHACFNLCGWLTTFIGGS